MCGIVGYVGPREATPILVAGLRKLEYRGYDSAGLATISDRHIEVRRSVGKLDNLDAMLREHPLRGTPGVGHTRWATHGRPSEQNAHPHRAGKVVVIHNGIIENFLELRRALAKRGRTMASETDTEVISHLIDEFVAEGCGLAEATRSPSWSCPRASPTGWWRRRMPRPSSSASVTGRTSSRRTSRPCWSTRVAWCSSRTARWSS